ncbi:amidohydrolase family protein [Streptomyces sp. SID14478]|uniref:amidohydrolase family protein n=1 Tax=Streptomyces sp. SID14478 TaxID=2706073 RepID=UPI0013DCEB7F|nr:amidohydrolase family protein [Streptomyces sp. SID14478]NEB77604.1 amidohydrolase family protein [Streptomyces sp. SID14478]
MTTDAAPLHGRLLLKSATVVNTRDGTRTPDTDVLIGDGRILQGGRGIEEATAATVDASGTYVVPGYADMHAHALDHHADGLRLMLAHGVTGFRQMAGSLDKLRDRAAGNLRLPTDSPALLALPGPLLQPMNSATSAQAVATVREQYEAGADFIKVGMVTREVFFDAQAEATSLGLPIVGHLPPGIDVAEVSRLGMKSIEHLGPGAALVSCCSPQQDRLREASARSAPALPHIRLPFMDRIAKRVLAKLVVNPVNLNKPAQIAILDQALGTYDEDLARTLAGHFVADRTWQVPTLIRLKTQHLCDEPAFDSDPDLRYISPRALKSWRAAAAKFARFSPAERATFHAAYANQLALTKLFDDARVPMLAGSDCSGAAWLVPGASLHHEFDELARAGLSPLRILQMATLRPAEFLGATDTSGTVEPGKNADLVLLAADPLANSDNLHSIQGVIRSGRYYSTADLNRLKEDIAARRSVS